MFCPFLSIALAARCSALDTGWNGQINRAKKRGPNAQFMNVPVLSNSSLPLWAACGLCGFVYVSIIYGLVDGVMGDGRRDDIQLYEAVKAQQSWLL